MMNWTLSYRFCPTARAIADRHYNRQKPGTPQFAPTARLLVLLTRLRDARTTFTDLELDHIVAESKGGSHHPDNIQLLCRFCNRSKGYK